MDGMDGREAYIYLVLVFKDRLGNGNEREIPRAEYMYI